MVRGFEIKERVVGMVRGAQRDGARCSKHQNRLFKSAAVKALLLCEDQHGKGQVQNESGADGCGHGEGGMEGWGKS